MEVHLGDHVGADRRGDEQEQQADGQVDTHRGWIEALLVEYYDPMYVFQRESKAGRIEFAGEQQAVVQYLRERNGR